MAQLAQKLWADLRAAQLFADLRETPVFDPAKLYALANLSAVNNYETGVGGGETGDAAGFGIVAIARLAALGEATGLIAGVSASAGYQLYLLNTNVLNWRAYSGTPALVQHNGRTFLASDVGKIFAFVVRHTGTSLASSLGGETPATPTAITGYTPAGALAMLAARQSGLQVLGWSTFRGQPTEQQIQDALFAARALRDVPASMGGATTAHRWSLRDVLAGLDLPVIDGQTAPASLPDTVTAASIDAMARQGSPVVRAIDPSVDGRKTYGALGFATGVNLQTAPGLGLRGNAAGFTIRAAVTFWSLTGTEYFLTCSNASGTIGWEFARSNANMQAIVGAGSGRTSVRTLTAADLGQPHLMHLVFDGSTVTLFFDAVASAASTAGGFTPATGAEPMVLGGLSATGTLPGITETILNLRGGNYIATPAEIAADYAAWQRTQRLSAISGRTDLAYYEISDDIAANGGPDNGIPATVQDRIGTDHLTKVGGLVVSGGGLTSFGVSGYPQSATVASGLPGLATGLWVEDLIVAPATGSIQSGFSNTGTGANGLNFRLASNNVPTAIWGNGAVTFTAFGPGALTPGQTYHLAAVYDGNVGTIYVDGVAGTPTASFVLTPGTQPVKLGTVYAGTSEPATTMVTRGVSGGHAVPTAGEIAAAAAYALANGRVGGVAGKTLRLYDIVQDVADAGGKVPALIKDRVSNVDHLAVVGAPLQVAQRAERVWSYEASPILYGATGLSDTVYYHSNVGSGDNATAFGGTLVWIPRLGSSATRALLSGLLGSPTRGWDIRTTGTNSLVSALIANGAFAGQVSPTIALTAFHGKICVFSFQWDGVNNRLRAYLNRVEGGTGSAITGHAIGDGSVRLGATSGATGSPGTDNDPLGFCLWTGIAGLAQVQSQHDAILANDGHIQPMPGVTQTMSVNLTLDARANGNVLGATLVDRQGGNNLTATGSPGTVAQYARAFGF